MILITIKNIIGVPIHVIYMKLSILSLTSHLPNCEFDDIHSLNTLEKDHAFPQSI